MYLQYHNISLCMSYRLCTPKYNCCFMYIYLYILFTNLHVNQLISRIATCATHCQYQTCEQRAKKKSENCGSSTEARHASRVTQFFLTFLTAQRNSGASGEVNYRYLKFISCIFFLKLFYILILN